VARSRCALLACAVPAFLLGFTISVSPENQELLVPSFAFAFGAIIGSFLNVVIHRLPRGDEGLSISKPRLSVCPKCGETIRGYDNIPLISYFILAGRCRACRAPISLRYFIVELLTASLFAGLAVRFAHAPGLLAAYAAFSAALIAVTFIDIDHQIIPDKIDLPGMALAPAVSAIFPALHQGGSSGGFPDLATLGLSIELPRVAAALSSVIGIAIGAGVIYLVRVLGSVVFRKEAMGFGDVKLLGMIGGYLGWKGALLALLLGCLTGAVIGMGVKIASRNPYIPFGPFLSLGALLVVLWRAEVVHFIFVRWPGLVRGLVGAVMSIVPISIGTRVALFSSDVI
jgi:leader peptidase (prepilin peptidase)/N-methyltransferase